MITTILNLYKWVSLTMPSAIVCDTYNCSAQLKTGTAILTLQHIGKQHKVNFIAFQNVANHGKGLSDGVGSAIKRSFDKGSLGTDPLSPASTRNHQWGAALVSFGNRNLSHPAAGRPGGRLLMRNFYDLQPSDLQTPQTGTFPKQLDGAGVMRAMSNAY